MKKNAKRDSVISPAKEWAMGRNRAKGQFSYMLGTIDSMGTIWGVLTVAEQNVLDSMKERLEASLKDWDSSSDKSKTIYVERHTT